ncbi:MAG: transposase [Myxococcota bacterium]
MASESIDFIALGLGFADPSLRRRRRRCSARAGRAALGHGQKGRYRTGRVRARVGRPVGTQTGQLKPTEQTVNPRRNSRRQERGPQRKRRQGKKPQNGSLKLAFPLRRTDPKPGAGRPKTSTQVSHLSRVEFRRNTPVHVTLRVLNDVRSLRRKKAYKTIRSCFVKARRKDFQVVRHSVQGNHVHVIVEAASKRALARGMQGLNIRLAKRLNSLFRRAGRFFADRYHSRLLRTPREVCRVIQYLLNNRAKHRREAGLAKLRARDPCTSQTHDVQPRTWLLEVGWMDAG